MMKIDLSRFTPFCLKSLDLTRFAQVLALLMSGALFGGGTASAAIVTWFGYDLDDSRWEYATNWDGGVVPGVSDEVHILYDSVFTPGLNPHVVLSEVGITTVDILRLLSEEMGVPTLSISQHATLAVNGVLQMQNSTLFLRGGIEAGEIELVQAAVIEVDGTFGFQTIKVEDSVYGEGSIQMNGGFLILDGMFTHTGGTWLSSGQTDLVFNSTLLGGDGANADFFAQGEDGEAGQAAVNITSDITVDNPYETQLFLTDSSVLVWGGWGGYASDHDSGDGGRGGDGGSAIVTTVHGSVMNSGQILGGFAGDGGEGELDGGAGGHGGHGIEFVHDGRYTGDGFVMGGDGGWGGDAVTGRGGNGGDGGDAIVFHEEASGPSQQEVSVESWGVVAGGMSGLGGIADLWTYSIPDLTTWIPTLMTGSPLADEDDFALWQGGFYRIGVHPGMPESVCVMWRELISPTIKV